MFYGLTRMPLKAYILTYISQMMIGQIYYTGVQKYNTGFNWLTTRVYC